MKENKNRKELFEVIYVNVKIKKSMKEQKLSQKVELKERGRTRREKIRDLEDQFFQ